HSFPTRRSSDLAPTPTAAAEVAVPVKAELIAQIENVARRGFACWRRMLDARRSDLRAAARALPTPDGLLAMPRQRLAGLTVRLPRALEANAHIHRAQYLRAAARLTPHTLRTCINRARPHSAPLPQRTR